MEEKYDELLKAKCRKENYEKLVGLNNPKLHAFIAKYVKLCNPRSVFARSDSPGDVQYIRDKARELGEESQLLVEGHTAHFDGYFDQARDKGNTRFLVTKDLALGSNINSIEREKGLREIDDLLKTIME